MNFNRSKNAKRTIVSGVLMKLFSILVPFLMRTIIIHTLGSLYLGLGSLFTSILNALNIAELGIGTALVFSMYLPVAQDDEAKICALLNVYKKTYLIIGIVVTTIGVALTPFLTNFIKGDYPANSNIYVIYLIQLVSTVSGYFFMAYKGSVLYAYQKMYVINAVTFITEFVAYVFQICVLVFLKDYYFYVAIIALRMIAKNIEIALIVDKKYPRLKAMGSVDSRTKKEITRKIASLVGHKIGGVVVNSVDNILISAFIGLEIVAIYNNYFYVLTALSGVFLMLTNGLHSIVGNYCITKSKEDVVKLFYVFHYLISLIICFCCTCLLNAYQPFMILWVGKKHLFAVDTVFLFSAYFFFVRIKTTGLLFKDSFGLWEKDVVKPYIQIIIDLVIDLILLNTIGIDGAIISTIACMVFGYFYETIVLFKYCFKSSPKRYYGMTFFYLLITLAICFTSYILLENINIEKQFLKLAVNLIVSSIVSIVMFCLLTIWSKEFKSSRRFLVGIIKKQRKVL